jgi:hypothetical protein
MKVLIIINLILLLATFNFAQMKHQNDEPLQCGYAIFQSRQQAKLTNDDLNAEPFVRFWQKFSGYTKTFRIDLQRTYQLELKSDFPSGKISEGDISFKMNSAQPELLELLKDFTSAIDDSNLLKILALEKLGEKITGAEIQLIYGEVEVEFNLMLKTNSENTAERATTRLKTLFIVTGSFLKNSSAGEFYKNAEISAKDEQIFVKGRMNKSNFINYLREF